MEPCRLPRIRLFCISNALCLLCTGRAQFQPAMSDVPGPEPQDVFKPRFGEGIALTQPPQTEGVGQIFPTSAEQFANAALTGPISQFSPGTPSPAQISGPVSAQHWLAAMEQWMTNMEQQQANIELQPAAAARLQIASAVSGEPPPPMDSKLVILEQQQLAMKKQLEAAGGAVQIAAAAAAAAEQRRLALEQRLEAMDQRHLALKQQLAGVAATAKAAGAQQTPMMTDGVDSPRSKISKVSKAPLLTSIEARLTSMEKELSKQHNVIAKKDKEIAKLKDLLKKKKPSKSQAKDEDEDDDDSNNNGDNQKSSGASGAEDVDLLANNLPNEISILAVILISFMSGSVTFSALCILPCCLDLVPGSTSSLLQIADRRKDRLIDG
eukprot:gnl/MRDRNA2_/MRDRNA2_195465_c0_seq1.p1 gnl/MRDRNA2_/MRDRNA2_195465_c0~~gnl/MRDRNA2_/MRDRNA2_195465_c0_seq1.p1  ORF type:complete len:381 (+),score=102.61 gnl/MRDRNA2_/MRDRNA2_195465_c0_seq1:125-1267(+)